ncbi:MAG: insulinase family protein [Cellvibrionaceae bacterium]
MNSYRITIFFFFLIFSQFSISIEIEKGSLDKRTYHYQVLDNKIQVLLISDPEADKAAAALDVNVGSYHDPKDREGLAHFLEHMLFLGTQKYPEADEYQSFISDNGGSHNAYTSRHHTNYFFDIDVNQLEPALDRFAQFFIAPLFDAFYVDRERNAVHSEYQSKLKDDYRRSYDVYRHIVNPQHPDAQFNVGSLETLADRPDDKVRDDLLAFYKKHYSAHKMTLVVLGKEPIKKLQSLVLDRFGQIPVSQPVESKRDKVPSIPLFAEKQLPFEVVSQPIQELRQMTLSFELPSIREYYKEKPLGFIGHIIGHEGQGSLLSLLKDKGLAESLSAGGRDKGDGTSAFYITVQLTEEGVQQRDLIRSLIFYALDEIKNNGIEQWRYDEERLLAETAFHFREKSNATNTVSHLAKNLQDFPPEDIISADYLLERFDATLIRRFLSYMTPNNVYVSTVFPNVETNSTTRYYQVSYAVKPLSEELVSLDKKLTAQFSLPQKNPFIPENIALYKQDETLAQPFRLDLGNIESTDSVKEAEGIENTKSPKDDAAPASTIWAKQDISFGTPKAKVAFRIISPYVSGDLKGVAMNALYADIIQDKMNEYSYPALLANTALSLRANSRGLDITLVGYHDKLDKLMALFISEIDEGDISPERFTQLKADLIRNFKNREKRTPYHQLYRHLAVNLYDLYWSNTAKINAIESITLADLNRFAIDWRQGARVKGLFYGNIDQEWLQRWQPYIDRLQLPGEKPIVPAGITHLQSEKAQYDVQEIDHNDTAVALYVQGVSDSLEDKAAMAVLRQMLQSPFYTSLRTEQQLGYVVFVGSLRLRQVPGSVFIVQSPSTTSSAIQKAITDFIVAFEKQLPNDIGLYQQAVITQLLEAPTSLSASADDYWGNLIQGNESFDNRQRLAEAVKQLSSEKLKAYYKDVLINPSRSLWQFSRRPEGDDLLPFSSSDKNYQYP